MPKKTKKQKIISEYRKKIKLFSNFSNIEKKEKENNLKIENKKKQIKNLQLSSYNDTESLDNLNKQYFLKDFKKSIILIIFIITIEIALYFANLIK